MVLPIIAGTAARAVAKKLLKKAASKYAKGSAAKLKGLTKLIKKMGAKEVKWKSPKVVPKGGTSKQFAETFRKELKKTTGYKSGGLITGKPKLAKKGWK